MLFLPKDMIIHISTFTKIIYNYSENLEEETFFDYDYPMWNLYATCKHFTWMSKLECLKLCLDESIITTNINHVYQGPHYDIRWNDIDYYDKGDIYHSIKCDKEIMKTYPIIKYLIDKDDCDYIYLNFY
jgi:hypothetical protein